jgi:hypothetical protein
VNPRIALAPGACACLLVLATTAHAQTRDEAAAEALFDEGRRLMERASYEEACSKFEASQKLDPAVGTLLNLGDCLEHRGKTASAWARFREAEATAAAQHEPEREAIARGRAAQLGPRLCRLAVRAPSATDTPQITVARDGVVVEAALFGESLPVDAGEHEVSATAPRRRPWSVHVVVDGRSCAGAPLVVEIPALAKLSAESAPPLAPASTLVGPRTVQESTRPARGSAQRTVAWVVAGLAATSLAVSGSLAIDAVSTYHAAKDKCAANGCGAAAQTESSHAATLADWATASLVLGASAAVVDLVLWLSAPSGAVQIAPQVTPTGHGIDRIGAAARVVF